MLSFSSFNLTLNVSINESEAGSVIGILRECFLSVSFVSAIYLCVLSLLTVISNGVLLVALYHDPFKTFRQPPTIFIAGLATADFLTGLLVEPLFAYFYFEAYRDTITKEKYNTTLKAAGIISSITMNVSVLTILFLSWTQFIAITFPHRHKQFVTVKRVVLCVCGIWLYSLLFSSSLLMGVPERTFQKIDVFLNLTLIHFLVLVAYAALQISYRRQISHLGPLNNVYNIARIADASENRRKKNQKQFVVISLLLTTCLLVFIAPVTAMWYVTLYWTPTTYEEDIKATIASVVIDMTLFLKFLIDPFIYAWRLPKFRQAVKVIFSKRRASMVTLIAHFNPAFTSRGN